LRWVDEMESFISALEAVFEERAKHPVLLVGAVEESANVMLPAEIATGELYGMILVCHKSPRMYRRSMRESTIANAYHAFTAIAVRKSARRTLKYPWGRSASPGAIAVHKSARM
jgi:hypothetical protein